MRFSFIISFCAQHYNVTSAQIGRAIFNLISGFKKTKRKAALGGLPPLNRKQ
jgi:hypothetical protein